MHRTFVAAIWIGGLLLAAALYQAGPDDFVRSALDWLARAGEDAGAALALAREQASELLRAAAIAAFAVFLLLGLFAVARRLRSWLLLALVSASFLLLTATGGDGSDPRWVAALALAVLGAVVLTRRLTHAPSSPAVRR